MRSALVGSPRKTKQALRARPRRPHSMHAPRRRDEMTIRARPRALAPEDTRCNPSHHEVVRISLEIFYDSRIGSFFVGSALADGIVSEPAAPIRQRFRRL